MMSTKWCPKHDVNNMMSSNVMSKTWCPQQFHYVYVRRSTHRFSKAGQMKPNCIVHWFLVWTIHPEDLGNQGPRAVWTPDCDVQWTLVGTVVRRHRDPRTESCPNFISNCHFTFRRIRIFVRGAVIACWPHSRFWVKDSHLKLADSFDESLDLSDWLKSGDSFSSSV